MKYLKISNNISLFDSIQEFLHDDSSIIFDIECKYWQEIIPTLALKFDPVKNQNIQTGLDDMYPFLDEHEKI